MTLQQQETTTTTSTTSSASSAAERTSNTTDDKETFQNNSTFHHNVTDDDEESLLAYDVLLEELNPLEYDDWTTTTDTAQNGNYTIQFGAGWSVLFKNPEFWYDNFPDRCHPEKTSTISISCHAHGQNEQQYQQATIQFLRASSDSIQCNQTAPGTLECYEAFDRYQDIVNQFTQVVYVRLSLYFFLPVACVLPSPWTVVAVGLLNFCMLLFFLYFHYLLVCVFSGMYHSITDSRIDN